MDELTSFFAQQIQARQASIASTLAEAAVIQKDLTEYGQQVTQEVNQLGYQHGVETANYYSQLEAIDTSAQNPATQKPEPDLDWMVKF